MDSQPSGFAAERRVWGVVPEGTRQALESGLAPTNLQTLLMAVARARARKVTPARVLQRWRQDRLVRPLTCDPRPLAQLEATLWRLLPHRFAGVELSPVAPLGTCSALAPVDQHRVVSTVRGSEVLSDPTNALAVEAAVRRREQNVAGRVDLAACHRVLRAQQFGPGNAAPPRRTGSPPSATWRFGAWLSAASRWGRAGVRAWLARPCVAKITRAIGRRRPGWLTCMVRLRLWLATGSLSARLAVPMAV
jgi:hypothetical protein